MNYREGDIVQMAGKVSFSTDTHPEIRVDFGHGESIYAKPAMVKLVKPVLQPGDTVRLKKDSILSSCEDPPTPVEDVDGVVLAIAHDHAWVEIAAGVFGTWWLENVERIRIAGQEPEVWAAGTKPEGGEA